MLSIEKVPCDLRQIIAPSSPAACVPAKAFRLGSSVQLMSLLIVSLISAPAPDPAQLGRQCCRTTEAGEVAIEVVCTSEAGQRMQVAARDTGIGIAVDQLDDIFIAFPSRCSTTRRFWRHWPKYITRRLVVTKGGYGG